jgi:aspartate-semialdehyde dehydrogenase
MKEPVAILGCTGLVGRKLASLLENHPFLELSELRASERSAGTEICGIRARPLSAPVESRLVFSALPADVAASAEPALAAQGKLVITKASALRMEPDVPVLVPEVNPGHLALLAAQKARRRQKGAIVADPNCTTGILSLALKPLQDRFGIDSVIVSTMQAVSGAGVRGVGALEVTDNVLPFIPGEEEKIEREAVKVLGSVRERAGPGAEVSPARFGIRAACHRVAVIDGHSETVHVSLSRGAGVEEAKEAMRAFRGLPQELSLPTAPERPLIVREEPDRPQPRLDRNAGGGMSVTVGRVRRGLGENSLLMDMVGHNLVRGAAGASVLDAELLVKTGKLRELLE